MRSVRVRSARLRPVFLPPERDVDRHVAVTAGLTLMLRALKVIEGPDQTVPENYRTEAGEEGVSDLSQPA